ncbi:DUF805 domain-containing protein [Tamlana sp. I1]|uniref:DUF805 domain-containing protein n=1 Tax=Tamlana sp. I1 TaxID=2762061 RepID=UPI0018907D07|nr:DUF805 domain-containing protein [Tamlana sp. I1]
MNWYLKVLKDYANFKGRARRKEYWMFVLFNVIFSIIASILDSLLGTLNEYGGAISLLYSLVVFIPGLAVTVRRLHDVGKSGWMFFIILIPLIGTIWLLVLLVTDSKPGTNEWGPNPKSNTEDINQIGTE